MLLLLLKYSLIELNSYKTNTKVTLLNNDEKLMMEYVNWVYGTKATVTNYVSGLKSHKERAVRIMQFLQKEYHLKELIKKARTHNISFQQLRLDGMRLSTVVQILASAPA